MGDSATKPHSTPYPSQGNHHIRRTAWKQLRDQLPVPNSQLWSSLDFELKELLLLWLPPQR